MSTITETKSEAQVLLDALNATADRGHVYEIIHDFKVDGRSKEGKTFKKLQGYKDVTVHPISQGKWYTYFLVIWDEVKDEYADALADIDVNKAAIVKSIRASFVDSHGETLWFCLTTENEQGFAWLTEYDRESRKMRERIEDITSGDLVKHVEYEILRHRDELERAERHAVRLKEMEETQPLTNHSQYALSQAAEFIAEYDAEVKTKTLATMDLRDIHEAGIDRIVAELCRAVIEEVGGAYGSSPVQRTVRSNKEPYTRVQIDDVIFWLATSWRNQQWNHYEPFMDGAMKKFQSLISY